MATTKNEAVALLKGPYGREIANVATSYTSVIFWGTLNPHSGDTQIGNGSVFFLDCGEGVFAVTADHVYQAYLERKELEPNLICQIGNVPFAPETRLIDQDPILDVATFRIDEREIVADGKVVHRPGPSTWPPKPPEIGKGVFFAGFPRVHRSQNGPRTFEWGSYIGVTTATSVTDQYIACQFDRQEMVDMFGTGLPPEKQWLGGLSGAPLWTLVQTDIFSWRLGGVIYQYSSEFEILYARRSGCIARDGHLRR